MCITTSQVFVEVLSYILSYATEHSRNNYDGEEERVQEVGNRTDAVRLLQKVRENINW